jgi:F-type H+-transporting ATPase subunit a
MSVFSSILRRFTALSLVLFLVASTAFGQDHATTETVAHDAHETKKFDPSSEIVGHVLDAHYWHFWDGHYGTLYLPVIVYSSEKSFDIFSSKNFFNEHHEHVDYKGYSLHDNHIYLAGTDKTVLDLSITKNVAMLFITAALMLIIFPRVASAYKKNAGKAPKGAQSFFEPIILFVRDEIVKPNIGRHYERFFPYILTLFFFILFANILGLLPGAANLSGNIAVTLTLAVLTFIITNVNGNKGYWGHIFWTPGVPLPMRPIILLVEVVGIFTKPISLMVRLFVAITAGHIVLLSLISLTFIFGRVWVGVGSSVIVLFINLIEILVAGIQAYVFALFTSLYIGMAIADHEHH